MYNTDIQCITVVLSYHNIYNDMTNDYLQCVYLFLQSSFNSLTFILFIDSECRKFI